MMLLAELVGGGICLVGTAFFPPLAAPCAHAAHIVMTFEKVNGFVSSGLDVITNPSYNTIGSAACNAIPFVHSVPAIAGKLCNFKDNLVTAKDTLSSLNMKPQNNPPQPSGLPPTCPDGSQPDAAGSCLTSTSPPMPQPGTLPTSITCPDGSTPAADGTCPPPPISNPDNHVSIILRLVLLVLLRHNRQLLLLRHTHGMAAINDKNLLRYPAANKLGRADLVVHYFLIVQSSYRWFVSGIDKWYHGIPAENHITIFGTIREEV